MRQALAEVGCLIVYEIHLLRDAARGPVLEALPARVRGESSTVRIMGLSATVANADVIAGERLREYVRRSCHVEHRTWCQPYGEITQRGEHQRQLRFVPRQSGMTTIDVLEDQHDPLTVVV